jgi:hypothetical protein
MDVILNGCKTITKFGTPMLFFGAHEIDQLLVKVADTIRPGHPGMAGQLTFAPLG